METQRNLLIAFFVFVSFLLYQQWQIDSNPDLFKQAENQVATVHKIDKNGNEVVLDVPADQIDPKLNNDFIDQELIHVETDVLSIDINSYGDIVHANLLKYNQELKSPQPFKLLEHNSSYTYIAQSGLIGRDGIDSNAGSDRPKYISEASTYKLSDDKDFITVKLQTKDQNGIDYIKSFTFKRSQYAVDVAYSINNTSDKNLNLKMYGQLKQTLEPIETPQSSMPVYRGGAYSSSEVRYSKYSFDDMQDKSPNVSHLIEQTKGGWIAMLQHYFVSAWLPNKDQINDLYFMTSGSFAYIGYKGPIVNVAPNSVSEIKSAIWIGPKLQDEMAQVGENLDLTVDYGWLWFVAQPMFKLLKFLHSMVGNWGVAIILITFVVKGLMYPLTKAQYTSMAKMRILQPKLKALQERYGEDRQKLSEAMMKLYKEEKVNPLGGCFPILLQMPIFIALYWTLMESVELRQAPFFGWIHDLSAQDPYYILPILMGISMFLIQKMSPNTATDPMQQKIMQYMPVMFTFFFLWFPSGLVLYWLISNVVTMIQQWMIFRALEQKGLQDKKK